MSDVAAPAAPAAAPAATPTPAPADGGGGAKPVESGGTALAVGSKAPAKPTKPAPGTVEGVQAEPKEEDFFEIEVDGQKERLTRDQAVRELQKRAAAEKRFREAKELTKKNQAMLEMLKDPERVEEALTALGHDLDALSERRIRGAVEREMMTPEQREAADLKRKVEKYEAEEKKRTESAAKVAQDEKDKVIFGRIEEGYLKAANRAGLEGTPDNLLRMVEVAIEHDDLGVPLTPDQVIAEVREREDKAFGALEKKVLAGLEGEALAKRLGPAVVDKVLKWSVAQVRGRAAEKKPAPTPAPPDPSKPPQYIGPDDFLKKHNF